MEKLGKKSILGVVLLGLGAIAVFTNPSKTEYRKYAEATLKTRFKEKICTQVIEDLGVWLEGQCRILVDIASPNLSQVVSQQTNRQDLFLFSLYQANLPLPSPLPSYQLETIGILGNFYTYQAKKL